MAREEFGEEAGLETVEGGVKVGSCRAERARFGDGGARIFRGGGLFQLVREVAGEAARECAYCGGLR